MLDATLQQAACTLLAEHQDIGRDDDELPLTAAARAVIDSAWRLQALLRRYRAALARHRQSRDIPF